LVDLEVPDVDVKKEPSTEGLFRLVEINGFGDD
jgi:hypothetical protein